MAQSSVVVFYSNITHALLRYFEGGVSSVYMWDLDHGFAGVILIKKAGDGSKMIKGCWDSIHVIEVQVRAILSNLVIYFNSRQL